MKKQKLSLSGVKNALGRNEMRNIMAGSGGGNQGGSGCSPNITPEQTFYCHDSSGYTLGSIYTNCCSSTPQALQQCQVTWAYTTKVTGPC
jgi:hypothetical protein